MKTSTALSYAGIIALTLLVWASTSTAWATVAAEETITGRLVESGCAAMGSAEPSDEHVACMVRCAKDGDPIGILTDDGIVTITGNWAATHPDDLTTMMAKQVRGRRARQTEPRSSMSRRSSWRHKRRHTTPHAQGSRNTKSMLPRPGCRISGVKPRKLTPPPAAIATYCTPSCI
jgi:hypothetical protein